MSSISPKPVVFLSGADGNAFTILGACSKAARREGWNANQIKTFSSACYLHPTGSEPNNYQTVAMRWNERLRNG